MRRVSCYLPGLPGYGYFIGVHLANQRGNLTKIRSSIDFYNLVSSDLENFLQIYDYNKENVEKYFSR